jgi:hypothetical protein
MDTLQFYIPGFRHNDLSTSNILLQVYTPPTQTSITYACYDAKLQFSDNGVFAAVWDLDLAHAPGRLTRLDNYKESQNGEGVNLRNYVILENKFAGYTKDLSVRSINGDHNESFDLYFFFRTVLKAAGSSKQYKEVKDFIRSLTAFRGNEKDLSSYAQCGYTDLTPRSVLNNPLFRKLCNAKEVEGPDVKVNYARRHLPLVYMAESGYETTPFKAHRKMCLSEHGVCPTPGTVYDFSRHRK